MNHRVFAGIASALALSASMAAASDYSDFRIPSHSTSRLELSLFGGLSSSRNNHDFSQRESNFGQANASGLWASGYDSERLRYALLIAGGAVGARSREQESNHSPPPFELVDDSDREVRSMDEFWSLQASVQNYPTSRAWALGAGVFGDARYSQRWFSMVDETAIPPTRNRAADHIEEWTYQYSANAFISTGWGRIRDATGVQQVQFIEDRLIHDGVLTGPLQQQTRQSLAELFYLQLGFRSVHDQPDRFFWSEFERILRTDPALRTDMYNAYAVMRASDPVVVAGRLEREAGTFVGPLLTLRHTNDTRRLDLSVLNQQFSNDSLVFETSSSGSGHFEGDDQLVLGGLQATVEQPLSTRWHLSLSALGQCDVRGVDRLAELRSAMRLRYWGGERWYADAHVEQFRMRGDDVGAFMLVWVVNYGGTVGYYLEDHVSLQVGAIQTQAKDGSSTYIRNGTVTVGLSYRRGTLTAPGLVGKVRPVGS